MDDLFQFATPRDAALCTRSRSTWWRWRRGATRAPRSAITLLRIVVRGELPQGGPAWHGWSFRRGVLCDPSGIEHTPATIEAWHWIAQELQELRARENQHAGAPGAAHALTDELYRRLEGER